LVSLVNCDDSHFLLWSSMSTRFTMSRKELPPCAGIMELRRLEVRMRSTTFASCVHSTSACNESMEPNASASRS